MSMYTNLQTFQGIASSQTRTTLHALNVYNHSTINSCFGNGYSSAPSATTETASQRQAAQDAHEMAEMNKTVMGVNLAITGLTFAGNAIKGIVDFCKSLAPAPTKSGAPAAGSPAGTTADPAAVNTQSGVDSLDKTTAEYKSKTGGNKQKLDSAIAAQQEQYDNNASSIANMKQKATDEVTQANQKLNDANALVTSTKDAYDKDVQIVGADEATVKADNTAITADTKNCAEAQTNLDTAGANVQADDAAIAGYKASLSGNAATDIFIQGKIDALTAKRDNDVEAFTTAKLTKQRVDEQLKKDQDKLATDEQTRDNDKQACGAAKDAFDNATAAAADAKKALDNATKDAAQLNTQAKAAQAQNDQLKAALDRAKAAEPSYTSDATPAPTGLSGSPASDTIG